MPYIDKESRKRLAMGDPPQTAGDLNYLITTLIDKYLSGKKEIRYSHINEIIGVLECAKLELYRRIATPYEDLKKDQSGDVYSPSNIT